MADNGSLHLAIVRFVEAFVNPLTRRAQGEPKGLLMAPRGIVGDGETRHGLGRATVQGAKAWLEDSPMPACEGALQSEKLLLHAKSLSTTSRDAGMLP